MARGFGEERRTETIALRVTPSMLKRIDGIRNYGLIRWSRSKALRELVETGLWHWPGGRVGGIGAGPGRMGRTGRTN